MKTMTVGLIAIVLYVSAPAYALYSVSDRGDWPNSWPKELESLRKQSRTLVGPTLAQRHYAVRFASRNEFEAAWPHILKVKHKDAPIILVRGKNFFLDGRKGGVVVHCPPDGQTKHSGIPIPGSTNERVRWKNANFIELVVDGEIVDLNRIPLPAGTSIIDERFKDKTTRPTGERNR